MRQIGRLILNGLTVASFIVSVLVAASWVRSYWRDDLVIYIGNDRVTSRRVETLKGYIVYGINRPHLLKRPWPSTPGFRYACGDAVGNPSFTHAVMGFGWGKYVDPLWGTPVTEVAIRHSSVITLFAVFPAFRLYRRLRQASGMLPGYCLSCGYDLCATPDRCPECGTFPPKKTV